MTKNTYARTLHYLCDDKRIDHPLIQQLESQLRLTIPKIEPNDLMLALQQHKHRILLFDHIAYTSLKSKLKELPLVNKSFETVVFNVPYRLTTDEILAFGHLKGLFYHDCSLEEISKGCTAIINGENWLPRNVSSQLLYHYRNVIEVQSAPAVVDLTRRELQLLRCLMLGASNNDIAEDLFISEFTVKSHMQKIFKKLCVKNRAQAAAWAKQHLNPLC